MGVDVSVRQLELARRRVPEATLVRGDLSRIAFAPRSFDLVVAFWSLIHVRRELHGAVLARIAAWLRPGGVFAATLGSGDNPAERADFHGAPMFWSHFDADTNRRLLVQAGLRIVQADVVEDEGERHLWVIAAAPVRAA